MTHEQNQNNAILGVMAFCFKIAGLLTVSEFFNLLLTMLSILSVTMLMVINWDKFILRVKKISKKRKQTKKEEE